MKKLTVLLIMIALGHSFLKGQQKLDTKLFQPFLISFPTAEKEFINYPITNIEIFDARPDNFCVGFMKNQELDYGGRYDEKSI